MEAKMKRVICFLLYPLLFVSPASAAIEIGIAAFDSIGDVPKAETIRAFEGSLGKNISTFNWYLAFNSSYQPSIPINYLNTSMNYHDGYKTNIIPMVTLEPWASQQDIANGRYDNYLRSLAIDLNSYGSTTRLRYGHEMIQDDNPATNGWYSWQDQPAQYTGAFRHVYDLMKPLAPKLEFVWSPNQAPYGVNLLAKYFPGKEYVDWLGIDGYALNSASTFDLTFKGIYHNLADHPEIFGDKPFMLAEVAAAEFAGKPAWIKDAFAKMQTDYQRIQAFYWFDVNKEKDWRLDSSAEAFAAFQLAMKDKAFISHAAREVVVTPEPVSSTLFLFGAGAITWKLRRRFGVA